MIPAIAAKTMPIITGSEKMWSICFLGSLSPPGWAWLIVTADSGAFVCALWLVGNEVMVAVAGAGV